MKKILLYGYGGAYNHGAEAILRASLPLFRGAGAPIFLSTHFAEQDREFGVDLLVDKLIQADLSLVSSERSAAGFEEKEQAAARIYREALAEIDGDTVCIGIGGDNYCYPNWHRQSLFHRVAKERGGTSILWGCSVQPEQMDGRMEEVLRSHDYIYARESLTEGALRGIGAERVSLLPDPAFLLPPQSVPGFEGLENAAALNLSPLMLRRSKELLYQFEEAARLLLGRVDKLLFLPHVCMPADNDREALEELAERLSPKERERIVWCPREFNAAQRKYLISRCRMLVCCRTHASIAGYSSAVPTFVAGYSSKSKGIGVDLGMDEWVIPSEDGGRLPKRVSAMWDRREEIHDKLKDARESVKEQYESIEV